MRNKVDGEAKVSIRNDSSNVPHRSQFCIDTEYSATIQGSTSAPETHNSQGKCNPAVVDGLALFSPNIDIRQVESGSSSVISWVMEMEIGRKSIRFQKPVIKKETSC